MTDTELIDWMQANSVSVYALRDENRAVTQWAAHTERTGWVEGIDLRDAASELKTKIETIQA